MRFSLLIFLLAALLVSSCHHSDFHKSHYPKSLKHSRNLNSERNVSLVSNIENQPFTGQNIDEFNAKTNITDSLETGVKILNEIVIDEDELLAENLNTSKEIPNSIIYLEKNNVNYKDSNSANQTTIEEEPKTESPKKRTFNRKSVMAFWMVWIMLAVGILTVILIFSDAMFLAGFLLLGVIVGCIFTIGRASQGAREIKNDRENQKGTFLSVLAILGSILGLILSLVVAAFLFNY